MLGDRVTQGVRIRVADGPWQIGGERVMFPVDQIADPADSLTEYQPESAGIGESWDRKPGKE